MMIGDKPDVLNFGTSTLPQFTASQQTLRFNTVQDQAYQDAINTNFRHPLLSANFNYQDQLFQNLLNNQFPNLVPSDGLKSMGVDVTQPIRTGVDQMLKPNPPTIYGMGQWSKTGYL